MRFGVLAAAAFLIAASPALAQNATEQKSTPAPGAQATNPNPQAERFKEYVTQEAYKAAIGQMAIMGDTVSDPECKDHKPIKRRGMTIYAPPTFAEGQHPVNGLWVDRIEMNRCGTSALQNVLIQAQGADKPPRMALQLPGETITNPPMQNAVVKDILEALQKKKCTDQTQIVPVNTKRYEPTKPIKINEQGMFVEGAWKETWSFKACGKKVDANVEFSSDGKGGLAHKVKL